MDTKQAQIKHGKETKLWTGSDLENRSDWLFPATSDESSHLVDMARSVRQTLGDDPNDILKLKSSDFDLGPWGDRLRSIMEEVRDGYGIALYRGLPIDDLTLHETAIIYWAMGLAVGQPMSNNPEGDMIGHVVDAGKDYNDPKHRGYQTNVTMDYHCDQSDVVTLLCINTAKSGGLSKLASSRAVYRELLDRRPDLVDVLSRPFCWTKHSEKDDTEKSYYDSPVFNFKDDILSTSFGPKHMEKGHALPEAPDITSQQQEAIDVMSDIAEELHGEMQLERGDVQFANNYTVLHTRTGFEDWPEPERRRTLWRLWLSVPDFLPRTPYSEQWRNGVNLNSMKKRIVLAYVDS